jgi:hypothetical protein
LAALLWLSVEADEPMRPSRPPADLTLVGRDAEILRPDRRRLGGRLGLLQHLADVLQRPLRDLPMRVLVLLVCGWVL